MKETAGVTIWQIIYIKRRTRTRMRRKVTGRKSNSTLNEYSVKK